MRTRIWLGLVLAFLAMGLLAADLWLAPYFPLLAVLLALASLAAGRELWHLFPADYRPPVWFLPAAVLPLLAANWFRAFNVNPWPAIAALFAVGVLVAFLAEMERFDGSGHATPRVAFAVLSLAYLGILPAFLAQLRWLEHGTAALILAVFVPKGCDVGAYFTGKAFGRHKMSPVLSPNKTWEGAAGGFVLAAIVAIGFSALGGRGELWWLKAFGFGLTVGLAGLLGDLAESMLKRDAQAKDASTTLPGFGGILDVIDAILFAAPVAYWWLMTPGLSPLR